MARHIPGFRVLTIGGEDISGHVTGVNIELGPNGLPTATFKALVAVDRDPETRQVIVTIGGA